MSQASASNLLLVVGAYALIGLVFATAYVIRLVARLDPAAAHATWGARALLFPAAVMLWPLLSTRLLSGRQTPPSERNAHRDATRYSLAAARAINTGPSICRTGKEERR